MAVTPATVNLSGFYRNDTSPIIYGANPHIPRGGSGITTYAAQLLRTGLTGLTQDIYPGNTITWMTDEAEGYARINWVTGHTHGLHYDVLSAHGNQTQVYTKVYIRRTMANSSKVLKINGAGSPYQSNTTLIGPTAGGYTGDEINAYWGDVVNSNNDNSVPYRMDGVLTGGGSLTRAAPTFNHSPLARKYMNITGAWEYYETFVKFNDSGVQNGECAIWQNRTLIFHASSVWNCADGTNQNIINYVGLGEYTSMANVVEDYKLFDISFERPVGRGI